MAKLPFRTILDKPVKITTPSGSKIIDVWEMKIGDNGEEEFYISGQTNIWEQIQSHEAETNIENILAMCTETGDLSYLEQTKGMYADISDYPSNIFEAHRKIEKAKQTFNELPAEMREKYDYSFDKFLADFGTENWIKNMTLEKEIKPKEEVKEKKEMKTDE